MCKCKQADAFAAELLMPAKIFKNLWYNEKANVSLIATMFFVSEGAVLTRAKELNLITDFNAYFL